jgi:hypothetical protein
MADEPTSEPDAPQVDAPDSTPDAQEPAQPAPPWGSDDEFSPEKAWNLIQNLRRENADLKPFRQKVQELEDAEKSETQRLAEQLEAARSEASEARAEALRAEVRATRPDLKPAQVARLQGDTIDELLADADEVYGLAPEEPTQPTGSRPKERLRSGAIPAAEPRRSIREIVQAIPRV